MKKLQKMLLKKVAFEGGGRKQKIILKKFQEFPIYFWKKWILKLNFLCIFLHILQLKDLFIKIHNIIYIVIGQ